MRYWPPSRAPAAKIVLGVIMVLTCISIACRPGFRTSLKEDQPMESGARILKIDDFAGAGGLSALGTEWRSITDQVMGGVSTGSHAVEEVQGERAIRLRGRVSLENNGGFVQVALPLHKQDKVFDVSQFTGLRIRVRGNGETYNLHLRTSRCWLPWQYFFAEFKTTKAWQEVELPFEDFKPESFTTRAKLDPAKLKRVAIVAIGKAFDVDVAVSRIELYR